MTGAPRRRSLFWVITGAFLLTALMGTFAQALITVAVLRPLEARDLRARAELAVARFEHAVAGAARAPDPLDLQSTLARLRGDMDLRFTRLVFRYRDGRAVVYPPLPPIPGPPGTPLADRDRVEVLASREVAWGGTALGTIQVVRPERPRGRWPLSSRALLLSLPVALIASLIGGLLLVRLLVRRLRALDTLATRVADGDLSVRIADAGEDEIGRVAQGLNRMTERLDAARADLDAEERRRRQLFADITHELATPLTSIRAYAETLVDPKVAVSDAERTRYIGNVLEESRHLDRLIRDLFDLARLEADASPFEREPLDWAALCRNTVARFAIRFRDAGLGLAWEGPPGETWIVADGRRMEQVLENLFANALRYVPAGGSVTLAMTRADCRARLVVSDDGPGATPEELPHLFERFYRSPTARGGEGSRDLGGSGLGLAIVREIVQRHGGTVAARTRAPHGLAITIEMPAQG